MTATTTEDLAGLAAHLHAEYPGAIGELTRFPSGSVMLDVRNGSGSAFVIAHWPPHGYMVDQARSADGLTTDFKYTFSDLESAAAKLRELLNANSAETSIPKLGLNLLVLHARNLKLSKAFYENLGLAFHEEWHGSGPQHYAAEVGPLVFELYPCGHDETSARVRLGFDVPSLDHTLGFLRRQSAIVLREPHDSPWGRRAVVQDPDGNRVELIEKT